MKQLGLFAGRAPSAVEAVVTDEDRELASRLPAQVHFGTSSWTFQGWPIWKGAPSAEALARDGLRAYATHPLLRTVGIDRSYYGPLRDVDLEGYADQLQEAPSFRAISKVWDELTTAVFPKHPRYGARGGTPNPHFLDADRFLSEVLAPYQEGAFARHAGPFVFELTPMPRGAMDERTLATRVEKLLERLPASFAYAFELRNEDLFGERWLDVLHAHGASHVFNYWTAMPSIRTQLARPGALRPSARGAVVARLMLPRYTRYDVKKAEYAPFDKLVEIQPEMRDDVLALVRAAAAAGSDAFVIVNNKAEGCAPLTIRALASRLVTECV